MKLGRAEPLVTALVAGLVRVLAATWRYRVQGWEHVAAARASGRPVIYVLWHSRILPLLYHRRDERLALLISRHRSAICVWVGRSPSRPTARAARRSG